MAGPPVPLAGRALSFLTLWGVSAPRSIQFCILSRPAGFRASGWEEAPGSEGDSV